MTDEPALTLRLADRRDSDDLLAWRNDPVTRANSRNVGEVARSDHDAWLARALADPSRRIWIAERGTAKAGTVSAVRTGGAAEISITVAPALRGRGVGAAMLRAGTEAAQLAWPDAEIRAVVRTGNAASRHLFEGCGFVAIAEEQGFLTYRWAG